jgi:hypothetical protein
MSVMNGLSSLVELGTTQDRCQFSEQLQTAFYDSHG